jgi:hypothetical protein
MVIVERVGLGADPDAQVTVAHDVAQEGRVDDDIAFGILENWSWDIFEQKSS